MKTFLVLTAVWVCSTAAAHPQREALLQPLPEYRSIDGVGNNQASPYTGSTGVLLRRLTMADYADGVAAPAGAHRPSARAISNVVSSQTQAAPNAAGVSDFVWQWGQFLDHDIDLTGVLVPAEPFDISVPSGDPWFDPHWTGTASIPLDRSYFEWESGVREQINEITAWIDASNVYGSDEARALELRTLDGTGRLKMSPGGLLPFNSSGLPNAPSTAANYFLAGDFRANEQVGLTAMHTLFVREHNHWAARIASAGSLGGDDIYELARAIVGAEMQVITYHEFLPVLLGPRSLAPYSGYRPGVKADISNLFATAAYRFGHSMLSPTLLRIDADGRTIAAGNLPLEHAFFNPDAITSGAGIEPLLRGLAGQVAQEVDLMLVDGVRNFLFGQPGSGGFDLASLNIQRGRDHGLASYNRVRRELGLAPARSLIDISSDPRVRSRLAKAYAALGDIDVWVGGLAEDHAPGALVGETFRAILKEQFQALRDGDRFWYENHLPPHLIELVEGQSLARIIRRNTRIDQEIADDVFHAAE